MIAIESSWQGFTFLFVLCTLFAPYWLKPTGLSFELQGAEALWRPLRPFLGPLESLTWGKDILHQVYRKVSCQ